LLKIDITTLDMILIVFFAALIMGIGLGMVVKKGGTTGGTEVLQKIIFKYLHIPYSKSLYILDGIVIFTGFLLGVNDLQTFLYAIIFTYLSGVAVDAVVFSGFNKRAVYIISDQLDAIREEILHNHERGLTSAKVIGEYSKNERTMLICVLSSNEYFKLRDFVEKVDPKAFLYAVRASEVRGEGFTYD
ncbi:MAG: YitT family protein, partial [Acholeplasmataceae bacterium]|nr:YitT family protein [Acholeplasmataceae bacterium]